jgi:predicted transposase YdaD
LGKPFDATTKKLIEGYPADWIAYAGLPPGETITVVDADLSSFSFAADKVIRVGGPFPYVAHFEFQSSIDQKLDWRILLYSVLLRYRHGLPVRSIVIMLRPEALSPSNTGRVEDSGWPDNRLDFSYKLARVWEQPASVPLKGGLGTLPLALISDLPPAQLQEVVRQVEGRLDVESPSDAREIETAAYILMGLRYSREMIGQLLKGTRKMKESVTYQAIFEEGEARGEARGEAKGQVKGEAKGKTAGERNLVIRLASKKFGPPDANALFTLHAITDVERIEFLAERLLEAASWEDLLRA